LKDDGFSVIFLFLKPPDSGYTNKKEKYMDFIKSNAEFDLISMGEVMLRLSPPDKEKISQCEVFEKNCGGSEFNVAAGAANLGARSAVITKLPKNKLGHFVCRRIRYGGVSDDYVTWDESDSRRLGIYYYESGVYPRKSAVVYDRAGASVCSLTTSEIPEDIYEKTRLFHISSITLALSPTLRETALEVIKRMKENGVAISFDVNYRAALWSEDEAREVITSILPLVDILFVSEETSRRMFGMSGTLEDIHREFSKKYPNLKIIASTKRKVISPQKHTFSSLVFDAAENRHFEEAPYENIDVVDRIGSGDAYVAGALYGLLRFGDIESAAKYGDAMCALKNTVLGDMTVCDLTDIERIIKNHSSTGPKSEMIR
jgi:2-dehydro-3-deoxygluconokinase